MKYFTADQHFGHQRILEYTDRGFKTIQEMGEAYIEKWNSQVQNDDIVYHLGDFCLGALDRAKYYLSQLRGDIKVVPGNHDDRWVYAYDKPYIDIFSASNHPLEVLPPISQTTIQGNKTILCHYPLRSWRASFHGSWHLYGHVHGRIDAWGLSMDVGVDRAEGSLYSEDDIVKYMFIRKKYLDSLEKP